MNYWWVNQSRGWTYEHDKGIVCSKTDTTRPKYREMVSKAGVGDFIVHYTSSKGIMAVSRVKDEPVRCEKNAGRWLTPYGEGYGPGWMLRTNYCDLTPIPVETIKVEVLKLKLKDSPVLQWRDGQIRIRQEYFIPFSREGLEIIYRTAPDRDWPTWLLKDLRLP